MPSGFFVWYSWMLCEVQFILSRFKTPSIVLKRFLDTASLVEKSKVDFHGVLDIGSS
jgi:hypothetical protein